MYSYEVISDETDDIKISHGDGWTILEVEGTDFYADSHVWLREVTEDLQQGNVDSDKVMELRKGLFDAPVDPSKKLYEVLSMLTVAKERGWFDD